VQPSSKPTNEERVSASDRISGIEEQADDAERIPVHLLSKEDGVVYYARVGSGVIAGDAEAVMIDGQAYQKLCEAPCVASLRQGRNRFALSYHGADPIVVSKELTLYQPTTFNAEYQAHGLRRLLGGALVAAGGTAAVALVMTAPDCKRASNDFSQAAKCSDTQKWIGLGVGVVSAAVGITLVLKTDVADVTIVPGFAPPSAPARADTPVPHNVGYELKGLSLLARF
jgi:hypothetical protein